jgi:hypothetical protein
MNVTIKYNNTFTVPALMPAALVIFTILLIVLLSVESSFIQFLFSLSPLLIVSLFFVTMAKRLVDRIISESILPLGRTRIIQSSKNINLHPGYSCCSSLLTAYSTLCRCNIVAAPIPFSGKLCSAAMTKNINYYYRH